MAASEPRRAEPWYRDSLMVTFAFHCNVACTFCMVEDVLGVFEGTSLDTFQRHIAEHGVPRGLRRVIFSGGEVTLSKELPAYVKFARSLPGVEHVRLQTNATRLGQGDLLPKLRDAGVDEFFVSLHGADAASCDAITQKSGSFEQIVAGIRAIVASGAAFDSNTAIVEANFRELPRIVDLATSLGVRSMEFWNYWPRSDEEGARGMSARVGDVRPHLLEALQACVARDVPPVVKWFPRCLLGDFAWAQDDGQPPALIDDSYWVRRPIYACLYEGVCAHAPSPCTGLSDSYVRRHGWEEDTLIPLRKADPTLESRGDPARSLVQPAGAGTGDGAPVDLASIGLAEGASVEGFVVRRGERSKHDGGVDILLARGEEIIRLRLHETSDARRCFGRTKSFDLSYTRVPSALESTAQSLTKKVLEIMRPHDPGGLRLPR